MNTKPGKFQVGDKVWTISRYGPRHWLTFTVSAQTAAGYILQPHNAQITTAAANRSYFTTEEKEKREHEMKETQRTNIFISDTARALLSALGAAVTGKPSMAAGLAELVSRVTEGVTAYPSGPKGQYKAYWLHPGQAKDDPATDNQFTEYAYPSRAEATAAAVLLRYEEARARALAQPEPEKVQP